MNDRQQGSTSYPLLIYMVLSSDGKTPATGKTVTVTISKNGGAFGASAGAVAEIGNGWYSFAGNADDRDTLGPLAFRGVAADCDDFPGKSDIVPWDPFAADLGVPKITGSFQAADYTAPDNAGIAAAEAAAQAAQAAAESVDGKADDIKAKTDQLVFSVPGRVDASAEIDPAEVGAAVWGWTPRTLTQPTAAVVAATQGADLAVLRGDLWTINLQGFGSLVGRQALWFTVKRALSQSDDESVVQITEGEGLLVLNGESDDLTADDGEIEVNDADAGDITITLKAASSSQVEPFLNYFYDVQVLNAAGETQTKTAAKFNVTGDVTRAIAAPEPEPDPE